LVQKKILASLSIDSFGQWILLVLSMCDNQSLGSIREACILFIDYLGDELSLLFSCETTVQANYSCDGCVFAFYFISLGHLWASKIQKSLLLTVAKKEKKNWLKYVYYIYMVNYPTFIYIY